MHRRTIIQLLLPILVCITGCSSPRGEGGGRVEIGETTDGERHNPQISTSELITASDEVAQALAADLNRLAEEDFGEYRVTLILGDISNKTEIIPTPDFELIQNRIKNKLFRSRMFRDNVRVREGRGRMQRLQEQELDDGPEDLLQLSSPGSGQPTENPQYVFFLLGDAFAVHRPPVHLYYIAFKLVRASDGEEVFSKDYEVKYDVSRRRR